MQILRPRARPLSQNLSEPSLAMCVSGSPSGYPNFLRDVPPRVWLKSTKLAYGKRLAPMAFISFMDSFKKCGISDILDRANGCIVRKKENTGPQYPDLKSHWEASGSDMKKFQEVSPLAMNFNHIPLCVFITHILYAGMHIGIFSFTCICKITLSIKGFF